MKKQWLIIAFGLVLTACGANQMQSPVAQTPTMQDNSGLEVEQALKDATNIYGISFSKLIDERVADGVKTYVYSDVANVSYLTVNVFLDRTIFVKTEIKEGQLVINDKEVRPLDIPKGSKVFPQDGKIKPQDSCKGCARIVDVPGHYDSSPVWGWVSRIVSAGTAGAVCSKVPGAVVGNICRVSVYAIVNQILTWVPGYSYCAEWVSFPPPCLTSDALPTFDLANRRAGFAFFA